MTRFLLYRIARLSAGAGILFCFFIYGCSSETEETKFTLLPTSHTQIDFVNQVENTKDLNIQNYGYFYDGGGVAIGDINNNGLPDIYFTGNEVENKLYLNKGDFVFEDITESSGTGGDTKGWSTGVTMADINGNGYLDIYVSRVNYSNKEGHNQLFINNKDNTFTEKAAEYGLDFKGYSKQAVFFDYNNSGRLDLFLLNHSFHGENTRGRAETLRAVHDPKAGDRLFRNDGDTFTDVTEESGIYSSALGYGLGVAVSDINQNGWPDIYVGNDFHEDDYLYINNGDGTFTESLASSINHTSKSSMGNDIADLTNNGNADIFSLDMLPEDNDVLKRSGIIDPYDRIQAHLRFGFKPKHSHNTLQLNRGNAPDGTPIFSEIGFAAGVAATEWSWATLLFDMDNDGFRDIFVANGMVGRPTDIDYNLALQQKTQQRSISNDIEQEYLDLIDEMPPIKVSNYAFRNKGDLTFDNKTEKWGLAQPSFSSGAAYADLNNNGSLDLVVNNVNMPSFIYRNNTAPGDSTNFLRVKLNGSGFNTSGIGSKVILYKEDDIFYQEQMPTRGFQSSVEHILHFGLGSHSAVDSLLVIWPDRSFDTIYEVQLNEMLELNQEDSSGEFDYERLHHPHDNMLFMDVTEEIGLNDLHRENSYNDFRREPHLPYKLSTSGPAVASGDVNGNGLDDIFIGGAHGQPGRIFFQNPDGTFNDASLNDELFEEDRDSEDVSAIFFDANGNGLNDLYVVSGGNQYFDNSDILLDRLYMNLGDGEFKKSTSRLPEFYENGSVVTVADFNQNGHSDLFVGSRRGFNYGEAPRNYLLKNDGNGNFQDVTDTMSPELKEIGMITDAEWVNFSDSGYPDLILAGEWMPVTIFKNDEGTLTHKTDVQGLENTNGLWSKLLIDDFNQNGRPDIIVGNFGKNSRLKTSEERPLRLYIQDFEQNGQISSVIAYERDGEYYPFIPLNELVTQFTSLSNEITTYYEYSTKTIEEIFGSEIVSSAKVKEIHTLASVSIENLGDYSFKPRKLPQKVQFSPVMGMHSGDFNGNGNKDVIFSGNLFDVHPGFGGRQDASYGLLLTGNGNMEFKTTDMKSSGFYIFGEGRSVIPVSGSENNNLIGVARNNQSMQFFRY
ncbi:MAG: VCBS repeat-containing protein [Balneolaceae bacterium]|nr:VCBS repeat-containing protein [Balneolaceae bacterium]